MSVILQLEKIQAGYRRNSPILRGLDLRVHCKEAVAVVGQNGSGKSTLAKSIMGMVPEIAGKVTFNGQCLLSDENALDAHEIIGLGVGFFMQGGRVFSDLTILENLSLACKGTSKRDIDKRVDELMQYFELLRRYNKKSKATFLSGGEKSQLSLAMVLMRSPKLVILDEPSAGLSTGNASSLYETLMKIRVSRGVTILFIEQNVEYAFTYADRICFLKDGKVFKEIAKSGLQSREAIIKEFFDTDVANHPNPTKEGLK